jgi:hypothetical protein
MRLPKAFRQKAAWTHLLAGRFGVLLIRQRRWKYGYWLWDTAARAPVGRSVTVADLERLRGERVRLPSGIVGALPSGRYCDPGKLAKATPFLASFLTSTKYEGSDQERDPGSFSVRGSTEGFQITLRDPTSLKQLRVCLPGLVELFDALETLLKAEDAPWETDVHAKPRKKLKKQKGG